MYTAAKPGSPESNAFTVSTAIGFAQGSHFNATWGQKDPDGAAGKEDFFHLGIGHSAGNTSVAATYTKSDIGGGGESWAAGVGHLLGVAELYAGYKHLNHDAAAMEDYGIFVIGSRIKFN